MAGILVSRAMPFKRADAAAAAELRAFVLSLASARVRLDSSHLRQTAIANRSHPAIHAMPPNGGSRWNISGAPNDVR